MINILPMDQEYNTVAALIPLILTTLDQDERIWR